MEVFYTPGKSVAVYLNDGTVFCWSYSSDNYNEAVTAAMYDDETTIKFLINATKAIMEGKINIDDGTVNGKKTDNKLMKLIQLIKKKGICDKSIEQIKPFLEKCIRNPYINGVEEIFDFITKLELKITTDGCFLAYKNVRSDLLSIHDGKTPNYPGTYVEVEKFDTNRTRTCSNGLHFCSKDYLKSYPGEVTVCVKVDPEDVVSIPTDYNFEKGRCKKYYIVGVMPTGKFFSDPDFNVADYFQIDLVDVNKEQSTEEEECESCNNDTCGNTCPKVSVSKVTDRMKEIRYYYSIYGLNIAAKKLGISEETIKRTLRKIKQYERGE